VFDCHSSAVEVLIARDLEYPSDTSHRYQ